jgi:hypothetical protein
MAKTWIVLDRPKSADFCFDMRGNRAVTRIARPLEESGPPRSGACKSVLGPAGPVGKEGEQRDT